MPPDLTREEYERTVDRLRSRRVTGVVYHPPTTAGDEGRAVEDWEFGPWHQPTMGVELRTDDGARFSAVWGDSFDHFGLEVFPDPMTDHLGGIGEPFGPGAVDVTGHPRWAGLVGEPLTTVEIAWVGGRERGVDVPVAVRPRSRHGIAWIAAGRPAEWPPGDRYRLGADDVMVVFTPGLAARAGIPAVTAPSSLRPGPGRSR